MLTSTRKETTIRSTLHNAFKTDPGMIPQFQALEGLPADTPGQARNGANQNTDVLDVRGEPGPGRRHRRSSRDSEIGASRVFVLDRRGDTLMPCHPARARTLRRMGRAVVARLRPFTIRLRDRTGGGTQPLDLKIDPGSRMTGMAPVRSDGEVLTLAGIVHGEERVRKSMRQRAACRRRRRSANLRCRKRRFPNRRSGRRLPPSLQSRVDNVPSWTDRFRGLAPVTGIQCETVRYDTQAMESPDIEGAECQQGTLAGYEDREYLLEKWGRTCTCCGASGTPLQIDHVRPKARGGSGRVSSLTLACPSCNQAKGSRPVESFLARRPGRLRRVLDRARTPLRDAAAACVGETQALKGWDQPVLGIRTMGRGSCARTRVDRSGFPAGHLMAGKSVRGFRTGDIVRAVVPSGKRQGVHSGRVAVRASGPFSVQTSGGTVQGVSHRNCRVVQRGDGCRLDTTWKETATMHGTRDPAFLPARKDRVSRGVDR